MLKACPKSKKRKCKFCKKEFNGFGACCSWQCALEKVKLDKKRHAAIEKRKGLEHLKTLSDYLKEAQVECNAYIRERDKNQPCISCGRFHNGQYHAGHYRSTGAAPQLRFNDDNIHKQCSPCNNHKSGNSIEYRINLIKRIGVERVEALERDNTVRKYTIEEVKAIKKGFKEKRKELERMR